MSWYKTGTIAATNGSKIITGAGTQFTNSLNGVSAGRMLLLPAAGTVQIYEIESVQTDTQLTLVSAFTGTTGTGKAYAIPTSPAVSVEQFAHEFASTLAYYQQQLSGWQQILTGAGNVTLTTPDGQTVTVRSQQAWDAALTGKLSAGDYGIGGAVPKAITQQGMHFSYSDTATAGTDLGIANNGVGYQSAYNTNRRGQIFQSFGDGQLRHRITLSNTAADVASPWRVVWDNTNLVKQTSQDDTTAGSVVINGGHGLGANARPRAAGATGGAAGCGFFSYTANHADNPFGGTGASGLHVQEAGTYGWDLLGRDGGGIDFRLRQISAGVASPWSTLWTSANLVKQTGPFDLTDGSMMINGAWGWGARGQVINSNDAAVLDFGRNPLQGSRIFRNDTTSAYTKQYGPSLMFKVADTWSILSVGYAASGASGGIRIAAGNNSGGNTVSHELWTNLNLNPVKDAASYVSITDAASLHSWALDASNTSSTIRNDGVSPATARYGSGWFSKVSGTYSVLTAGPSASTQTVKIQAGDANGYVNYELATLNTAQTITGEKTFTGGLVDSATNIGRLTSPSPVALTAVAQLRAMRNGGILFVDGSNSTAALMPNGSTSGYWFITSIGKNDTTSLAGMYYAVQQGTTGDFCIGFLTAAGVITWNALMNVNATQNVSGAKTFTSAPRIQATNATLNQESTAVTEATVGRWVQPTNQGNAYRFYVRAGSGGAPISGGERVITMPTTATGAILVSGNNAVADANGFWKTASPVIKLFANGTSELTSEAEGITTERLSEGVYRISGCLGLNADRAWGGDDGGIDVPMCRNKLPRLWVDYGGDEGSAQINPDGSIVIRTYHRPHPDAPAFARNEIEGYANGDPIDIPHDTFISVRVQMPEAEVQEAVVETVANEVESDVVLETSAQA